MDLREVTEFIKDTAAYIVIIAVILFVFTFIIAFQPVAGNSMSPTLVDGEVALVSKFAYYFSFPQRNEIVIINKNDKSYVKRIVGLPGESVKYLNGILYINDKPYKETFLSSSIKTSNFLFEDICSINECTDGVIPKNKYLVLGDNRPESIDSRDNSFGLVDFKEIKGKAFFVIFPFNKLGKVK